MRRLIPLILTLLMLGAAVFAIPPDQQAAPQQQPQTKEQTASSTAPVPQQPAARGRGVQQPARPPPGLMRPPADRPPGPCSRAHRQPAGAAGQTGHVCAPLIQDQLEAGAEAVPALWEGLHPGVAAGDFEGDRARWKVANHRHAFAGANTSRGLRSATRVFRWPNSSAACHSWPRSSATSETTPGSMRVTSRGLSALILQARAPHPSSSELRECSGAIRNVTAWLRYAEVEHREAEPSAEFLLALTEDNVVAQLKNLRSHPMVAARLEQGNLALHGWVYHIGPGTVTVYNEASQKFAATASM
jgi:hypothetical protein